MTNENEDYKLYVLAELTYVKENGNINESDLFPEDWYSFSNYNYKIEILSEALEKNCLIKDTEKYIESIEGIKINK